MKQVFTLFLFSAWLCSLQAQVPQAFSYQAVARDANEICLSNQAISLQISIYDSTTSRTLLYREEFRSVFTNNQGLFSISIGKGIPQPIPNVPGTPQFVDILWTVGEKWMDVSIDTSNGFNFQLVGIQQLLSVPFAINTNHADSSIHSVFSDSSKYSDESLFATSAKEFIGEPVGTVKIFWDANGLLSIPDGYMTMDGSIVNDSLSPLDGVQLPDMTNRYAVGVTGPNDTTPIGNSNHQIDLSHNHTVNPHNHFGSTGSSAPGTSSSGNHNHGGTGNITTSSSGFYNYNVRDNSGNSTSGNYLKVDIGSTSIEGQHKHNISNSGTHSHTVNSHNHSISIESPGTNSQLSSIQSIQPESIGFKYIIKVR